MKKNTWHYQILKIIPKKKTKDPYYSLREVYCESGKTTVWAGGTTKVKGKSKKELINNLKIMLKDAKKYSIKTIKE